MARPHIGLFKTGGLRGPILGDILLLQNNKPRLMAISGDKLKKSLFQIVVKSLFKNV